MLIKWAVDNLVPEWHSLTIPEDEFDDCETDEQRDEKIAEYVEEAFRDDCSFVWEEVEE